MPCTHRCSIKLLELKANNFGPPRLYESSSWTPSLRVSILLFKSTFNSKVMTIKANRKRQAVSTPEQRPNWPPLVPTPDLSLETVLEDQIHVVRNLFTSRLSRQHVSFLSGLPLITTPNQPKKGDALRANDRFEVEDPVFAEQLWNSTGLKDVVTTSNRSWGGDLRGLNPRIRIYRYKKGQFFGQHCRWLDPLRKHVFNIIPLDLASSRFDVL